MASIAKSKPDQAVPDYNDFDEYLDSRGIRERVEAAVEKRVIALQLDRRRKECAFSKAELARAVGTSRTQIDRVLDPTSQNISLVTLNRVAKALGKKIHYELVDL
jgi:DNA-binding phage protein